MSNFIPVRTLKTTRSQENIQFYGKLALAFFLLNMTVSLLTEPGIFFQRATNHIWCLLYVTGLHYLLLEYILRRIKATPTSILIFLLLLCFQFLLYSFGLYGWRELGILIHLYTPTRTFANYFDGVQFFFAYSIASLFFFGLIRHIYHYIKLKQNEQNLRLEKQEAELNYLKSQTNPHFLFNTLNNIYALTRDKSDLAPESVLRLSKILRFMLYESSEDYVAIEQELKIITDYIALEKLRYDESLLVNFTHDIEDLKQPVPPLLLIPLVENAFKHGVSETRQNPYVNIQISVHQKQILLSVKNSAESVKSATEIKENIGLSNLRRQLELLYKEYHLSVYQHNDEFIAELKINLNSHA